MGCFGTACFVNYKKKHGKIPRKKFNCIQSSPHRRSYEIQEALKLLAPPTKSIQQEDQILNPSPKIETTVESERQLSLIDDKISANEKSKDDSNSMEEKEESSSESSLFSLSIDSRRQSEIGDKEVCSPFKANDRETITSLISSSNKSIGKTEVKLVDEDNKENLNSIGDEAPEKLKESENEKSRQNCDQLVKSSKNDIVDDTSLSSWLVDFEKSKHQKTSNGDSPQSEKNYGDRQILGALTAQTNKTPDCGGMDKPLGVGTVGNYWRQINQTCS